MASFGGILMVSVVSSAMPSVAERPGMQPIMMPTSVAPNVSTIGQKRDERTCEGNEAFHREDLGYGKRTRKNSWKTIVTAKLAPALTPSATRMPRHGLRCSRRSPNSNRKTWKKRKMAAAAQNGGPRPTSPKAKPKQSAIESATRQFASGKSVRSGGAVATKDTGARGAHRHDAAAQRDHRAEHAGHQAGSGIGVDVEVLEAVHPRAVDDGRAQRDPAETGEELDPR